MEQFIFKFGRDEYICFAPNAVSATLKATGFVEQHVAPDFQYDWVPSMEGANIFRMSTGV